MYENQISTEKNKLENCWETKIDSKFISQMKGTVGWVCTFERSRSLHQAGSTNTVLRMYL